MWYNAEENTPQDWKKRKECFRESVGIRPVDGGRKSTYRAIVKEALHMVYGSPEMRKGTGKVLMASHQKGTQEVQTGKA